MKTDVLNLYKHSKEESIWHLGLLEIAKLVAVMWLAPMCFIGGWIFKAYMESIEVGSVLSLP